MVLLCVLSTTIQAEGQNLLDLDLNTFISALNTIKKTPGWIGYNLTPVFDFNQKAFLSFLYYKDHYEELCKNKNKQALQDVGRLFSDFNKNIIAPTETTDIIVTGSESSKFFDEQFYPGSGLLEALGKANRHMILSNIILPLKLGSQISYDADNKETPITQEPLGYKQLKNEFKLQLNQAAINTAYFENLIKNTAALSHLLNKSLFYSLGFSEKELKDLLVAPAPKPRTPLENLATSLAKLERQIRAKI